MSSSVTGRFSSGSMTLPSASVICSRLGCSTCSSVAAWARETLWFLSLRAYPCFLPELSEAWHSGGCMAPSKPAMRDLPSGTVTFLFTDIEGSTRLLSELGDEYADMLAEHRRVLRASTQRHGGVEIDTQGDAFFIAFSSAA